MTSRLRRGFRSNVLQAGCSSEKIAVFRRRCRCSSCSDMLVVHLLASRRSRRQAVTAFGTATAAAKVACCSCGSAFAQRIVSDASRHQAGDLRNCSGVSAVYLQSKGSDFVALVCACSSLGAASTAAVLCTTAAGYSWISTAESVSAGCFAARMSFGEKSAIMHVRVSRTASEEVLC